MKTVNDYIAHNDDSTEVIIEAYINSVQVERYYVGSLGNVPEELRSQEVFEHAWYVDADLPVLTIARNIDFRRFL